jgi:uncharacterized protein (DUF1015 family)
MAEIKEFRAIRPTRDKVHLVATRPYYTYKKNVLKAKLQDNPFTFLHIINPEFGAKLKSPANSPERFELVKSAYSRFMDEGILFKDPQAHIYVYRQTKDNHEYLGVVAGASVDEYKENKIKKHEATLTAREQLFTEYLDLVGFNAEPVLLSYSDEGGAIERILREKSNERAEYEYTTTDRIKHELWILSTEETLEIKRLFSEVAELYIADGHHRSASSSGVRDLRNSKGQTHYPNEDFFLAFLLEENKLNILEFNRLIRTSHLSIDTILDQLSVHFNIQILENAHKPIHRHQFTMCFDGKWFQLECKEHLRNISHPVESLDADILTRTILSPIFGITDLKTDENIEFIPGNESLKKTEKRILKGDFRVGFFLFPIEMKEVKAVADFNMIMPPKSTWVEPKLRSGLTIYDINE